MKGVINASAVRRAHGIVFTVAFALLLCLPSAWALGQHSSAPRVPHYSAPRVQPNRQPIRPQSRPLRDVAPGQAYPQYRGAGQPNAYRPPASAPPSGFSAANPGSAYQGQGYARPVYPGNRPGMLRRVTLAPG